MGERLLQMITSHDVQMPLAGENVSDGEREMRIMDLTRPPTSSDESVNFKHKCHSYANDSHVLRSPSLIGNANIDYDPHFNIDEEPIIISDTSDTTEQSGHTPLEYNTGYPNASMQIPSPARESSHEDGEEDGIFLTDFNALPKDHWGMIPDPAELEWMINNATADAGSNCKGELREADEKQSHQVEAMEDVKASQNKGANTAHHQENVVVSPTAEVRRSTRITNRSGPLTRRSDIPLLPRGKASKLMRS